MTAPLRVTIIPVNEFCSVDGVGFNGVDMSSLDPNVHAVQWYATHGDVEIADPVSGKMLGNNEITSLDAYQSVLDSYWEIRAINDAQAQEEIDEQTIIEV